MDTDDIITLRVVYIHSQFNDTIIVQVQDFLRMRENTYLSQQWLVNVIGKYGNFG